MKEMPASQLDPRVKRVWRINDAIWITLVLACVAVVVTLASSALAAPWLMPAFAAVAVVAYVVWLVVLPPIRYARWRYEVSEDYLDIARGIVWRKRFTIPFIRVQNTDTRQGPILRAFGLASVTVSTAAENHVIPGLDSETAEQLRDRAAELARLAREDV
ncbi:MAG: PH domain-containing protein [Eggerthellaceae bacterium]|nr:PH domain-containing protein [Eggerthellaceae bacterium]